MNSFDRITKWFNDKKSSDYFNVSAIRFLQFVSCVIVVHAKRCRYHIASIWWPLLCLLWLTSCISRHVFPSEALPHSSFGERAFLACSPKLLWGRFPLWFSVGECSASYVFPTLFLKKILPHSDFREKAFLVCFPKLLWGRWFLGFP